MNSFEFHWLLATCAPESIRIIRKNGETALYEVRNEPNTKSVLVLESAGKVVSLGTTYEDLQKPSVMSYAEASTKVAILLDLLHVSCS